MVTWEDLCTLASGLDENDEPRSACVLSVDQVNAGRMDNMRQVFLKNAEVNLAVCGGCIVAAMDLPGDMSAEYRLAGDACTEYFSGDDEKLVLTLVVNIYELEGSTSIVLMNPAFSDGYQTPDGKFRVIIAFDHGSSQVLVDKECNYQDILRKVESEIAAIDKEIDRDMKEALLEEEKAKNYDSYGDRITEELVNTGLEDFMDVEPEEPKENSRFRFVKEEGSSDEKI